MTEFAGSASKWNRTISAVLPAVVSIKVNRVRAFDTVGSGSVQATGFVVDKERGLILTNRHVAGPGPVVAEAIFVNNEEVPLQAVYYDPVTPRPPPPRPRTRARTAHMRASAGARAALPVAVRTAAPLGPHIHWPAYGPASPSR